MATRNPLVVGADGLPQALQSGDALSGAPNGNPTAQRFGYNGWTADPAITQSARTSTLGTLFLMALLPSAAVASGVPVTVEYYVTTGGASLTYGRIGIYSYSGGTVTLIGSADVSTVVTSSGLKTTSITLSAAINPGDILYIGCLFTGTTAPILAGAVISYQIGRGTPVRWASIASQAALSTSLALSSTTNSSSLFFFAF